MGGFLHKGVAKVKALAQVAGACRPHYQRMAIAPGSGGYIVPVGQDVRQDRVMA